nr:hypothetical protein [uncultured Albidiferax sp.]
MRTLFLSASALLCAAAGAQSPLSPLDPSVPVPAVAYRSVFIETPTGVETRSLDWKRAHADVAQFPRGHADVLKWERAQPAQNPQVAK